MELTRTLLLLSLKIHARLGYQEAAAVNEPDYDYMMMIIILPRVRTDPPRQIQHYHRMCAPWGKYFSAISRSESATQSPTRPCWVTTPLGNPFIFLYVGKRIQAPSTNLAQEL